MPRDRTLGIESRARPGSFDRRGGRIYPLTVPSGAGESTALGAACATARHIGLTASPLSRERAAWTQDGLRHDKGSGTARRPVPAAGRQHAALSRDVSGRRQRPRGRARRHARPHEDRPAECGRAPGGVVAGIPPLSPQGRPRGEGAGRSAQRHALCADDAALREDGAGAGEVVRAEDRVPEDGVDVRGRTAAQRQLDRRADREAGVTEKQPAQLRLMVHGPRNRLTERTFVMFELSHQAAVRRS